MQIAYVEVSDTESGQVLGCAQHTNPYFALLAALLAYYARCTAANYAGRGYGALESFTPPATLPALVAYCDNMGYALHWHHY